MSVKYFINLKSRTNHADKITFLSTDTYQYIIDKYIASQEPNVFYLWKFCNGNNYQEIYLTIYFDTNKKFFIKKNPSKKYIKELWNYYGPNRTVKNRIDSIINKVTDLKLTYPEMKDIDIGLLKKNLYKMEHMKNNNGSYEKEIIKQSHPKKSYHHVKKFYETIDKLENNKTQSGGFPSTFDKRCASFVAYNELPSWNSANDIWENLQIPFKYNEWLNNAVSCAVRPWLCLLFPIYCVEEYIYESNEKSTFWNVVGWILYIFLETIEIILILLAVLPEIIGLFTVVGAPVAAAFALPVSVITLLISIMRFDIIGTVFGFIGLIPFMGSIVRGLTKTTTSAASALRKIISTGAKKVGLGIGKTQKLLKITEPLLKASKVFTNIDDVMKMLKFGTNINKVAKTSDGVNDIIGVLIKSPDDILDIVKQIASKRKVASELSGTIIELTGKYGDDTVNMANKLLSSIPLDTLVDSINIIKKITLQTSGNIEEGIVAITRVIKFGNKYGANSQRLFKATVKVAKYAKSSSIKKVKGIQKYVNKSVKSNE